MYLAHKKSNVNQSLKSCFNEFATVLGRFLSIFYFIVNYYSYDYSDFRLLNK